MRSFEKAPDQEHLTERHTLGNIELGKYKVMFGYRLRAGFIGNQWYELDICCGAQTKLYDDLFHKVCTIIQWNIEEAHGPFRGIPSMSRIKPYDKDDEFLDVIDELYTKATVRHY